jgi:hypothetical protein
MQTILAIQFLKKLTTEQCKEFQWKLVHHVLPAISTEALSVQSAVRKREYNSGSCTLKHPDFIKKSFQTTLRYLLLYAAGLNGIEAKQLATVISNKRQATLKV